MKSKRALPILAATLALLAALLHAQEAASAEAAAPIAKPNILVVWGEDIGQSNISYFTHGLMGYETPNIDRIANEGMIFTDDYGDQSCSAGRSSFITDQSVFRTRLSQVGLPGAKEGMRTEDPTIAGMLKALGYATGQFGKNHLGDRDEHLPTNHGFDEFFGNLYRLNAEKEPENEDYPADMVLENGKTFAQEFGPRGVIRSWALPDGGRKIEDTGPLTKKRMEVVDDETSDAAIRFIEDATKAGKPWFVGWNGTRMHFRTHVSDENMATCKAQYLNANIYQCGMVEHDADIGKVLDNLDGYDILPLLTGETERGPRNEIFYFSDDGDVTALRFNDWKLVFMEQQKSGTFRVWMEPFVALRIPLIENLRRDPYERAETTSNTYLGLGAGPRLPVDAGAGLRGQVPGHLPGIPAVAESGKLQPGSGHGEAGTAGGLNGAERLSLGVPLSLS